MYTQVLQLVTQLLRDLDNCKVVSAPSNSITTFHFQITVCHPIAVFAFGVLCFISGVLWKSPTRAAILRHRARATFDARTG